MDSSTLYYGGGPLAKPMENRKEGKEKMRGERITWHMISSRLLFFASISSWMKDTFQFSSSWIGWYSMFNTSLGTKSLILVLSVFNKIFRRLEPVIDLASCWIDSNKNFLGWFLDLLDKVDKSFHQYSFDMGDFTEWFN